MPENALKFCSMDTVREFLMSFDSLGPEDVSLLQGFEGRVLAEEIQAADTVPCVHRADKDGYAVRAADTEGATQDAPITLECFGHCSVSHVPQEKVQPGQCMSIVAGAVLPEGADAILEEQYTQILDATGKEKQRVSVSSTIEPMHCVIRRGEDAKFGACLVPVGTYIRPLEVALLASSGVQEEEVDLDSLVHGAMKNTVHIMAHKKPQVAIISTGDEVVPVYNDVHAGQVRDVNSHTLASLVREAGGMPRFHGIVPDSEEKITDTLERALLSSANVIIISGGTSASAQNLTLNALLALPKRHEIKVFCIGLAMSPGNPLILVQAGAKTIWAVSGQVTSAQIVMHVLVQPFLRHLQGIPNAFQQENPFSFKQCTATLSCNMPSMVGKEEYVRVRLELKDDHSIIAHPVLGLSGVLHTMTVSHGLVRIDTESNGLGKGSTVRVLLFS